MTARPVVKVYLLPADWSEEKYQELMASIVSAISSIGALMLTLHSEEDVYIIFPKDHMAKGLGEEILIEFDLPKHLIPDLNDTVEFEDLVTMTLGKAVQRHLPKANIQCKIYPFEAKKGCWVSH